MVKITDAALLAGQSAALDVLHAWLLQPAAERATRFDLTKDVATAAIQAAWPAFVTGVEGIASPLCDCSRNEEPPINPDTRQVMDHQCDCGAVDTAEALLGSRSSTRHATQCSCSASREGR